MTKRRLLRWSLILVILAAFAVWLEPTRVVWGWLRGEAFYQARPTSWWRDQLAQFQFEQIEKKVMREDGVIETAVRQELVWHADNGGFHRVVFKFLGAEADDTDSPWDDFMFDNAADRVLAELQTDSSPEIRAKAIELARLRRAANE